MIVQAVGGFLVLGGIIEVLDYVMNQTTFMNKWCVFRARLGLVCVAVGSAMLALCARS